MRAPDEYRRETLAGPVPVLEEDPDLERVLEESRRLQERRQQRMAEFAPLLSKLKRIGFYDMLVQKEYVLLLSWCEAYYEDRHSSVHVSFENLALIRWSLPERAALDKVKLYALNNT
jgi:hypothetical protein